MKLRLLALAATAVTALVATSASAATYSISTQTGLNISEPLITDFNSTDGGALQIAPGYSFSQGTDGNAFTRDGSDGLGSGMSAPPPADNGVVGAYYETVLTGGSATLTSDVGLSSFSFYMGSPDDYNGLTITIMGQGGSIIETGSQIWGGAPDGTGLQTLGYTITYTFSPGAAHTIEFTSTGNSFEFDRLAGVTVPEPASWALMIGGFGLAGVTLRAKRRQAAAA
jgi:hypothetical protein